MKNVTEAVEQVRRAVADASTGLRPDEYRAFLEELLADAEGWKMELQEMGDEDEGD